MSLLVNNISDICELGSGDKKRWKMCVSVCGTEQEVEQRDLGSGLEIMQGNGQNWSSCNLPGKLCALNMKVTFCDSNQ